MADLRVRFIGDAGNLRTFFGSIQGQTLGTVKSLESLSRLNLSSLLNIPATLGRQMGSSGITKVRTELDTYNNTIKQIAETALRLPNGSILPIGNVTTASGNYTKFIEVIKNYGASLTAAATAARNARAEFKAVTQVAIPGRTAQIRAPFAASIAERQSEIALQQGLLASIDTKIARTRASTGDPAIKEQELNSLLTKRGGILQVIEAEQANIARLETEYTATLSRDVALQELKARAQAIQAGRVAGAQQFLATRAGFRDERAALFNAPPPIPTNLRYLQSLSPSLFKTLQREGLGAGPGTLEENLLRQQASVNAPRAVLGRGTTQLSGEFIRLTKDGIPVVQEWSAEIDKSGKSITRMGGQLSGASQTLKQISRDFQKVIEWTVATTVVFGALQYTIQQLNNLKELDFALQKFAITAQQSPKEAAQSFAQLASIAKSTATPLLEIIGAADDIALATQKAGQSTEDWNRQILSLTESVGVFTNLTGTDTVTATDLLTATMKQLRLTAADIPAILSKITAVAGGQSQAISDITKGLSVMAEAGRLANLSVDQQIATVQVLSQVTSKTPAEVATAFKNLVGSLGSPAALKGLASFNIAVRDQAGNLRNILDVYAEISAKIKSGIIPTGDVQGLIRAISGGPRRAPDAAALLAAIDQISTAESKSAQATNEAAIANAKAIDTTKAKLIQLQSTIDAVTFEKFGGEFKTSIGALVNILTNLLNAFNQIPTGVVAAAIQIGAFFIAIRTGTKLLTLLGGFLGEIASGFVQVGAAALASAEKVGIFNAVKGGLAGSGRFLTGANVGKALGGIALGAGLSAATGGTTGQIIGGGLQGLGISLLAFPDPSLLTKVAGGIALLGGTLLQFATATKDVVESDADKAAKILDSFSQLKSASFDLNTAVTSQKQLAEQIDNLSGKADKTAEEYVSLDAAQKDYAKGLIDTIEATKQASVARQALIDILKTGDTSEQAIANELQLASTYGVTGQALEELIFKYQKILLLRANPDLVFPDLQSLPSPTLTNNYVPPTGSTQARGSYSNSLGSLRVDFDLKDLTSDASIVKRLFNETGTAITGTFEATQQNIDLISTAIQSLKAKNDPLAQSLASTFNAFVAQKSAIQQASNVLATYQAYIDGFTFINPAKAAELQKLKTLVDSVIATVPEGPPKIGPGFPDLRQEGLNLLDKALQGKEVPFEDLKKYVLDFYSTFDKGSKEATTALNFLGEFVTHFGFTLQDVGIEGKAALGQVSDAAVDAAAAIEEITTSLRSDIADRLGKLQQDLQAGNITKNQYAKATSDLRAYLSLVDLIGPKFGNAIKNTVGFNEALNFVQEQFTNIAGLEDAASLSSDDFIKKILSLADAYGLNGAQLETLGKQLIVFYDLVNQLNDLKVNIPIGVTLDLTSIRAAIASLKKFLPTATRYGGKNLGEGESIPTSASVTAQLSALSGLESLLSALSGSEAAIQKTYYSGRPPGGGGGTTRTGAGAGTDVSELYLPKEIAQATNAQDLINQAIINAKKLQATIPGATKDAANDLVVIIDGLTKVMQVSGVKQEYLQKALDALTEQMQIANSKADIVRRIRVGAGDFSAIANVPVNSQTGVSVAGSNQINITFNLNGTNLTPAEFQTLSNMIGAEIARRL